MKRIALAALPQPPNCGVYLYALETDAGTVKVGSTRTPRQRITILYDEIRRKRKETICAVYLSELSQKAHQYQWERKMVHRCAAIASPCSGREWFSGVAFHDAVRVVDETCVEAAQAVKDLKRRKS